MHGDVDDAGSIVLSWSSFVHYDSRWKPVGALVQSLMMTKHLLVVGASMTDDNLLRFAYEVAGLRASIEQPDPAAPEIGTVVHLSDDAAFSRLWKGRFEVVVPTLDTDANDEGPEPGAGTGTRPETDDERRERERAERRQAARALTIFLDVVAMHAERDAPHLLDDRYAAERGGEAFELVARLRDAAAAARRLGDGDAWCELADTLDRFGAGVTGR